MFDDVRMYNVSSGFESEPCICSTGPVNLSKSKELVFNLSFSFFSSLHDVFCFLKEDEHTLHEDFNDGEDYMN